MRNTRGGLLLCHRLPTLEGVGKGQQKSAESIVGQAMTAEGSNGTITDGDLNFDDEGDAESYD
jgi:hypothetical protein